MSTPPRKLRIVVGNRRPSDDRKYLDAIAEAFGEARDVEVQVDAKPVQAPTPARIDEQLETRVVDVARAELDALAEAVEESMAEAGPRSEEKRPRSIEDTRNRLVRLLKITAAATWSAVVKVLTEMIVRK